MFFDCILIIRSNNASNNGVSSDGVSYDRNGYFCVDRLLYSIALAQAEHVT